MTTWRVLPECEAKTHNSVHSVTKAQIHCICPRAKIIREEYLKKQKERAKARSRTKKLDQLVGKKVAEVMKELEENGAIRSVEMMSMEGSACSTPEGVKIADLAFDISVTAKGQARRGALKDLCHACPVRERCLAETKRLESPAGVWGGVWGGQDMWERAGQCVVFDSSTNRYRLVTMEDA